VRRWRKLNFLVEPLQQEAICSVSLPYLIDLWDVDSDLVV
jgi:hypothetical protein